MKSCDGMDGILQMKTMVKLEFNSVGHSQFINSFLSNKAKLKITILSDFDNDKFLAMFSQLPETYQY